MTGDDVTLRDARVGNDVVDVLIRAGKIVTVGSVNESANTEIQLDGRALLPGLWDNHVHMTQWSLHSRRPSTFHARSAREAADTIAAALAASPVLPPARDGRPMPFVGTGFRDGLWPDAPSIELLDEAGGGVPIVVVSADLHSVWLNTAASERFGITTDATGLLREEPAFAIEQRVNDLPESVLDDWVAEAGRAAARRGVVGIVDLEIAWNADPWLRRLRGGFDTQRVEFGVYPHDLERAVTAGLRTGAALHELLTVGPLKIMTDGSLGTRTAYCFDEYPGMEGQPGSRGLLAIPPHELRALLQRGRRNGFDAAVHAIGDHANTHALDAFEELGIPGRIEHAQLLTRTDVDRLGALGVVASVQPEHALDDRDITDHHWQGRTDRAFLLQSILDAGGTLAMGSDAPVAPLDPWVTIAAAVTRTKDGLAPWHPEEAIDLDSAIRASVRTTIEPGQPADLVAIDADVTSADAATLRAMPVALTMLAGRVTHSAL
ncbi:MAG TPA: amidohydrolase family protein [Candidatus Agrococcus pullicola]|uniref:Amidohydrolase family protein n=1 Tax=Candidatus Agrococcus pullicola TaxID=2838429 RepID=A0A9D2CAG9_9MICO|nr:amidohydrolase family protein [Candidatus Agrococcus pullicola]